MEKIIQSACISADPAATLGIKLDHFTFEIPVMDYKNVRRRFRASNFLMFAIFRIPFFFSFPR
uniref:CFA20 domain-containing protein n=1 Tax=Populus trichocarpa TaxID=3694 RepID=A0A2K1WR48_POPTR